MVTPSFGALSFRRNPSVDPVAARTHPEELRDLLGTVYRLDRSRRVADAAEHPLPRRGVAIRVMANAERIAQTILHIPQAEKASLPCLRTSFRCSVPTALHHRRPRCAGRSWPRRWPRPVAADRAIPAPSQTQKMRETIESPRLGSKSVECGTSPNRVPQVAATVATGLRYECVLHAAAWSRTPP